MKFLSVLCCVFLLLVAGCSADRLSVRADGLSQGQWDSPYGGTVLQGSNYRLHTTIKSESQARFLLRFMEASHGNYRSLTGLEASSDRRGEIYIFENRRQWADMTRRLVGRHRRSYLSIQAGGYCYRDKCVLWDIGFHQTRAVAAHEGMHQFLRFNVDEHLPMWLEEGLCTLAEGSRVEGDRIEFDPGLAPSHYRELRRVVDDGRWIPLRKLLTMDASDALGDDVQDAVGYYAQLWGLIKFIRSRPDYRGGLDALLRDAAAGNSRKVLDAHPLSWWLVGLDGRSFNQSYGDDYFRSYISDDLAGFETQYRRFADELTRLD